MNLSVNEAKLTGLWARNYLTIQQVLIPKYAFGPEKLPGLSRNRPQASPLSALFFKQEPVLFSNLSGPDKCTVG